MSDVEYSNGRATGLSTAPARWVLITGGASGIGFASARACAASGWKVVLLGFPGAELESAVEVLRREDGVAMAIAADVREYDELEAAVAQVVATEGVPSAVIASAGIAEQSSVLSGDPQHWRRVIDTNLIGTANTIRAVAPLMAQIGIGDVILIASCSGREIYVGEPAYIASKWGTVGLGHATRRELDAKGVRVCLIEPGLVETPLTRGSPSVRRLLESGPSLRADDVAEAVLWVLSRPPHVAIGELVLRPSGIGDIKLDLALGAS